MRYFLVVYNRRLGTLELLQAYDSHTAALDERFRIERAADESGDIEVVVLGAADEEALRRTHNRYFVKSIGELVG